MTCCAHRLHAPQSYYPSNSPSIEPMVTLMDLNICTLEGQGEICIKNGYGVLLSTTSQGPSEMHMGK